MDRETLKALLDAENVDPSAYSLDGGMPFGAYVFQRRLFDGAVYFSERGLRSGEVVFQSEDAACAHLLDLVFRDDTTSRPASVRSALRRSPWKGLGIWCPPLAWTPVVAVEGRS